MQLSSLETGPYTLNVLSQRHETPKKETCYELQEISVDLRLSPLSRGMSPSDPPKLQLCLPLPLPLSLSLSLSLPLLRRRCSWIITPMCHRLLKGFWSTSVSSGRCHLSHGVTCFCLAVRHHHMLWGFVISAQAPGEKAGTFKNRCKEARGGAARFRAYRGAC